MRIETTTVTVGRVGLITDIYLMLPLIPDKGMKTVFLMKILTQFKRKCIIENKNV